MRIEQVVAPVEAFLASAPDSMVIVDHAGRIRAANRQCADLFGYDFVALVGTSVEMLVPDDVREDHAALRGAFTEAPTQRPMGDQRRRLRARRADGTSFPVQISLSPLRLDDESFVVAAIRDMTAWVESERELAAARRKRTIAEEHERFARDLHDTVIQELFAIGMSLQAVQGEAQPEGVADRIARAVDALDDTIRQIRSTIFELNSGKAHTTLTRDLDQLVRSLAVPLGFTPAVTLIGPLDHAVPKGVAAHVVPTVREGLTNIVRHARATTAEVVVQLAGDELLIEIRDDGVGMTEDSGRSSGLGNLARRATDLGGSLHVGSNGERGTVLSWRVPIELDENGHDGSIDEDRYS